MSTLTPPRTVFDVISDFLGSGPSLQEIADYRLPEEQQVRAHELLDKNRQGMLTSEEQAEINEFRQVDHLLTLMKAKARLKLRTHHEQNLHQP